MLVFSGFFAAHAAEEIARLAPKSLPAIQYEDETGSLQTLNPAGSKLTAIHFWATWCAPCIEELPEVDRIAAAYADKGLSVLALSLDGRNRDKVEAFYQERGITTLKVAMDPGMKAFRTLKFRALPTTIFVDRDGNMIGGTEGPIVWSHPSVGKFLKEKLK